MIEKTDIGDLKGIGEKTKKLFEKINIHTVGDLIRYYPHGYDVYEEAVPVSELDEDPDRYRRNLRSCAGIRKQPDAGDNAVCKRYYRNIKGNLVSYAILAEYVIRRRRDHLAWKSRSQENG